MVGDEGMFEEECVARDPSVKIHGSVTVPVSLGILKEMAEREGGFVMKSSRNESFQVGMGLVSGRIFYYE